MEPDGSDAFLSTSTRPTAMFSSPWRAYFSLSIYPVRGQNAPPSPQQLRRRCIVPLTANIHGGDIEKIGRSCQEIERAVQAGQKARIQNECHVPIVDVAVDLPRDAIVEHGGWLLGSDEPNESRI